MTIKEREHWRQEVANRDAQIRKLESQLARNREEARQQLECIGELRQEVQQMWKELESASVWAVRRGDTEGLKRIHNALALSEGKAVQP